MVEGECPVKRFGRKGSRLGGIGKQLHAFVGAVSIRSAAAFSLNAKRLNLPNPRSHLLQRPHYHCRSYVLCGSQQDVRCLSCVTS